MRQSMTSLLHVLATLTVIPYGALAVLFVLIGRVASTKGLWAVLDAVVQSFNWVMSVGLVAFAVIIATVSVLGCFTQTRLAASIALLALAGISLLVLLFHRDSTVAFGELLFMLPCMIVVLYEAWRIRVLLTAVPSGE